MIVRRDLTLYQAFREVSDLLTISHDFRGFSPKKWLVCNLWAWQTWITEDLIRTSF